MYCLHHPARLARLKYEVLCLFLFFSERYPDVKFEVFEST
jgi:hypothetical protein